MRNRRSDLEIAALDWAKARITLTSSGDDSPVLPLIQRDREALRHLLGICTLELARNEIATVELMGCVTIQVQGGTPNV